MTDQTSGVQSLDRTFGLIETLSRNSDGLQLTELTQSSGLHKSTVHRLLSALITLGYVKREEANGRYQLTLKLFELGGRVVNNLDLVQVARGPLESLRNLTQEAVHLVMREGCDIVYVYKVESKNSSIHMFSRIGMRRPMYCTGVGKSILSTMSDEEVERIWKTSDIKQYTENTILTLADFFGELEHIRKKGYALDNEENELGVRCIAAPIFDYSGKCRAAFSISAPISRMADERIQSLAPQVLETSQLISSEMGYINA